MADGEHPYEPAGLWFEEHEPAARTSARYQVGRLLAHRRTPYQELLLFESPGLGKVLVLDGIVQLTELDTYAYHELLAHPAMCAHPNPRTVAIVGGGDVHLAAEVLKHPEVERVLLLELDKEVIEVAREHFPVAAQALADPRLEVRAGDAFEAMAGLSNLDVILCDLTDPIGQAARLFEEGFYARCARALGEEGVLAAQTESLHFHRATVQACQRALAQVFPYVALVTGGIATYPGAWWTFSLAAKGADPRKARRRPDVPTRLYHPDAHSWFFVPEPVLGKLLGREPAV